MVLGIDADLNFVHVALGVLRWSSLRLIHDTNPPYPDLAIGMVGEIRARDSGNQHRVGDVTCMLHLAELTCFSRNVRIFSRSRVR